MEKESTYIFTFFLKKTFSQKKLCNPWQGIQLAHCWLWPYLCDDVSVKKENKRLKRFILREIWRVPQAVKNMGHLTICPIKFLLFNAFGLYIIITCSHTSLCNLDLIHQVLFFLILQSNNSCSFLHHDRVQPLNKCLCNISFFNFSNCNCMIIW